MAKKSSKNESLIASIAAKAKKAHKAHRDDPTELGVINLPPGISGGVAQLVKVGVAAYKSGKYANEPYFFARAVVKKPKEFMGIPIVGQQASIMVPLCDTPDKGEDRQTFDDNYGIMLNELRKLGVDTSEMDYEDLEEVLKALEEEKPMVRFSTRGWTPPKTKQDLNPKEMVFTSFDGTFEQEETDEDEDEEEEDDDVEEEDEEEEESEDEESEDGDEEEDEDEESEEEEDEEEEEEEDDDEEEEEEEEQDTPAKGEVVLYKPPKAKKPVECKVTAVFAGKETCNLKSLDDEKIFKAIPWSKLETEE